MKLAKLFLCFVLICQSFLAYAQTAGSLQEVPGSPFASAFFPSDIAFSPLLTNGEVLAAVVNNTTISVYSVNPTTGALTPVAGSPFPMLFFSADIAFSPLLANGNLFAAVSHGGNNSVSIYSVNTTTGAFTLVNGSPFPTGLSPSDVAFSPLVNDNLFAAVVNLGSNTVSVYMVNTNTGALTSVGSPFPTGVLPSDVAFSPLVNNNLFAAVTNIADDTVSVYNVNTTTGVFTPIAGSPFPTGASPTGVAFSPLVNGNLFAAVTNTNDNTVSVYSVNTTTGVFIPVPGSPFTAGLAPLAIDFSPLVNGDLFAAVSNSIGNTIFSYRVNTTTGTFTLIDSKPTGNRPSAVAYSPLLTNGNLFVATPNRSSDNISVYEVILPPTVTSVTPSTGPTDGGTTVIITGTQFTGATAVLFGTTPALSFTVDSENQITAVSPPGVGTVDVTVTTPVGTSAISAADQFTYIDEPVTPPLPPRHLRGCQKVRFDGRKDSFVNILTWKAPRRGTLVVAYQIYRDRSLTRLIGVVPNEGRLKFRDPVRKLNKTYTYFVVSVDEFGNISEPVKVKIRGSCGEECQR